MRKGRRGNKYRQKTSSKISLRLMSCVAAFSVGSQVTVFHSAVIKKATEFTKELVHLHQ